MGSLGPSKIRSARSFSSGRSWFGSEAQSSPEASEALGSKRGPFLVSRRTRRAPAVGFEGFEPSDLTPERGGDERGRGNEE